MKLKLEKFEIPAYFIGMMVFLGAMFVESAILAKPFQEFVHYLSEPHANRSWQEWGFFWASAAWTGALWVLFYIGFKVSEQLFLKRFLSKVN